MAPVDVIDAPPDFDPIGAEYSPDQNAQSFAQWEAEISRSTTPGFGAAIAPLLAPLPVWFEAPEVTVANAHAIVMQYALAAPGHPFSGHAKGSAGWWEVFNGFLSVDAVRLAIVHDYYARMTRATDGRTKIMHGVMRRSIDILRATTNANMLKISAYEKKYATAVHQAFLQRDQNLANTVKVLNANLTNMINKTITDMKTWTLVNVAAPIQKTATADRANTLKLIGQSQKIAHDDAAQQVAVAVALLMATINPIKTAVGTLVDESNDCVKPMCQTLGPKSDLGKLLTAANIAKWLAIFAALETISVKELEAIAVEAGKLEGNIAEYVASKILDALEAEHG